jgi:hypothetical protein
MNAYQSTSPQQRLSCAAAAVVASTLVLSSVLWLFASASAPTAAVSTAMIKSQPVHSSSRQVASRATTASTSVAGL